MNIRRLFFLQNLLRGADVVFFFFARATPWSHSNIFFTRNHWRQRSFHQPNWSDWFWVWISCYGFCWRHGRNSKWRAMSPSCGLSVCNFTKRSSTYFRTYLLQTSIFNIHFQSRLHPWSLTVRPWKMVGLEDDPFGFGNFSGANCFSLQGGNHLTAPFLLFNDIRHRWKTWHLPKVHVVQKNLSLAVTKVECPPWWIMMNCDVAPQKKLMRQNSENVHPVIFF